MRLLMISTLLLSLFLWNVSYSQDNIYTWKDQNGVLNITDVPPPPGAEIIDVSPTHREEALEHQRKLKETKEQIQEERLEEKQQQQAIDERKQKAAALDKADELLKKADEMRHDVKGDLRKKHRYEIRAQRLEEQAEKIIEHPELIEEKNKSGEKTDNNQTSGY